jgi:putative transposase
MTDDPGKQHRRSIRLRGYDYALAGAYFVSIVTGTGHACLERW